MTERFVDLNNIDKMSQKELKLLVHQLYWHSFENKQDSDVFSQIFDHLRDALFLIDPEDYKVVLCNQGAADMFDLERKANFDKAFIQKMQLIPTHLISESTAKSSQAISETYNYEVQYLSQKGRNFWGSFSSINISLKNKAFYLVRITDITSFKQAQIQKAQQKVYFDTVIENSVDPIWAVDVHYQLTFYNSAFSALVQELFAVKPQKGMAILSFFPPDLRRTWEDFYERVLGGEQFSLDYDFREAYYKLYFRPIMIDKKIQGVSVQAQDITDLQRFQEALKAQNQELRQANTELDRFAYQVSHDLRSPLRSSFGILGLLEREDDPKEQKNYLAILHKALSKMDNFIQDMLDLSKSRRGQPTIERVNWQQLIEEVWEFQEIDPSTDKFHKTLQVEQSHAFHSDSKRLKVIINNLLSNAIRYGKPSEANIPQKIGITVHTKPQFSEIWISDNGSGIPEEHQGNIFKQFYRASNHYQGTGLGLYIVQELSHLLQGEVQIDYSNDTGTCFYLRFPDLAER